MGEIFRRGPSGSKVDLCVAIWHLLERVFPGMKSLLGRSVPPRNVGLWPQYIQRVHLRQAPPRQPRLTPMIWVFVCLFYLYPGGSPANFRNRAAVYDILTEGLLFAREPLPGGCNICFGIFVFCYETVS